MVAGGDSLVYRRVLLKLSGEFLRGRESAGLDARILEFIARELKQLCELGTEVGLVIGGGNLFRGAALEKVGLDRVAGDQMGMLATVMNGIAVRDVLERFGVPTLLMSSVPMSGVVEEYDRRRAVRHLQQGYLTIFAGGLGNPLFTTDSAACLRALEVGVDLMLKGTRVNGVYSADPEVTPDAKCYEHIRFDELIERKLGVMDTTAICLLRDHDLPLRVFDISRVGALQEIVCGAKIGTLVTNE